MPYITGRNAYLSIGSQAAAGTAATAFSFLSLSGDSGVELTQELNIVEPQGGLEPTNYWIVGTWVAGRVEARLHPAYDATLINWIMSRDATGEAPYFSILQAYGSSMVWRFVDCKINTATITLRAAEVPTIALEFIGKTMGTTAWAAPTIDTSLFWLSSEITVKLGTVDYSPVFRSVELTFNNNIAAARDMLRFASMGPVALPAGDRTIEGRATLDIKTADAEVNLDTIAFLTGILGGTREGTMEIKFTRGGTTRTITANRVVWHYPTGVTVPSGGAGTPRTADLTFNCLASASLPAITFAS